MPPFRGLFSVVSNASYSNRWVRFLAKGLGIVGGFLAMFFGILGLISFSATCIAAVLLQM